MAARRAERLTAVCGRTGPRFRRLRLYFVTPPGPRSADRLARGDKMACVLLCLGGFDLYGWTLGQARIQDFSQGWAPNDGLVLECYCIVHFV